MDAGVVVTVKCALDFEFLLKICFKLCIDELHNGLVTEQEKRQETGFSISCSPPFHPSSKPHHGLW